MPSDRSRRWLPAALILALLAFIGWLALRGDEQPATAAAVASNAAAVEGMKGADGQGRFEADLLSRFRNVLKTGPILRMQTTEWSIESWAPPEKRE